MIYRLTKPHYEWRSRYGPPMGRSSMGSELVLNDAIREWLEAQGVVYTTWTQNEKELDGHTYLYFYIQIHGRQSAMMFKLTWL